MKLLVVEDAPRLRQTIGTVLQKLGHAVDLAADGEEGDDLAHIHEYDAIILDILLPKKDGLTLLQGWRSKGIHTPVLMLTALDQVDDRVKGLSMGADDYLVKPFAIKELAARLEAIHRRRHGHTRSVIQIGPLQIDQTARIASLSGEPLILTVREFSLLEYLALHQGQTVSRSQIETHLYDSESGPMSNAVDSAVYGLRRKLSQPGVPALIHTRRGLGYVLELS